MFLQFYGLKEQPFGVTPDPRFLYMGPEQQEAFASLVYGIEAGCGFVALIASPGLGKTTLLLRLMESLRDTALTAFLFQTHSDSREFLKNVLTDLAVEPLGQDLSELQGQLREVLVRGLQSGKRVVLVIDEAQNLDDSVLEMVRMLSNFETPQAKLLQTILVGQPALADKLARPHLAQLRQRISIIARFSPLPSRDEVEKYIYHRLQVAGYAGGKLFTSGAMQIVAKHSAGIPRVINNLCFLALSLGYARGRKRIDESVLEEVISDLDLESLGELRRDVSSGPKPPAVLDTPASSQERGEQGTPGSSLRMDFEPSGSDESFLGDINFTGSAPDRLVGNGGEHLSVPRVSANARIRSHYPPKALTLLAAVAVFVCVWGAHWLKPSLNFLGQTAVRVRGRPELQASLFPGNRVEAAPSVQIMKTQTPSAASKPEDKRGISGKTDAVSQKNADELSPVARSSALSPASIGFRASLHARAVQSDPVAPRLSAARAESDAPLGSGVASAHAGPRGTRSELVVQSSVSGARISLNGRSDPRWVTPHLFYLASGDYRVSVTKGGYETWAQQIHLDSGKDRWLMADLTTDQQGIFTVETEPAGMQVFIDGRAYGASRVETALAAGWHDCEVIPEPGAKPVVGKFHLGAGETLTRRIRVTTRSDSSSPHSQPQPAVTVPQGVESGPQGERLE